MFRLGGRDNQFIEVEFFNLGYGLVHGCRLVSLWQIYFYNNIINLFFFISCVISKHDD